MRLQNIQIGEKKGCLALPEGKGPFALAVLCGADEEILQTLGPAFPGFLFYAPDVEWERDLTPWPAPGLSPKAPFTGEGSKFLAFLEEEALPYLERLYPLQSTPEMRCLLGYSLGGLFAAWAFCQSAAFACCASISGSLWYDGWMEFVARQRPMGRAAYLSLGKTEQRVRNQRMRSVGECTRQTVAFWQTQLGADNLRLDWNEGGHFSEIPLRWSKAMTFAEEKVFLLSRAGASKFDI